MAARISRRAQAGIALCLGTLAGLAAVTVWIHRVELVLRPWLWSQVRGLQERRSSFPDDPVFREPTGKHGLSRFDVLLSRLIRLHQPDFCGGTNFELMPLRSEEGSPVYLAKYDPLGIPFDQEAEEPADEEEVPTFPDDGCTWRTFLAIDASGRALGEARKFRVLDRATSLLMEEREGFTTLRVPAQRTCFSCSSRRLSDLEVLSVDRKGIVPRGRVPGEGLAAPLCPDGRYGRSDLDEVAMAALLASAASGDLHRALTMIESAGPNESGWAEPLLEHPDPWLRARAAAIVGANPSLRSRLEKFLEDADPRVRFAAVEGAGRAGGQRCWEDTLLPLTEGNDQAVAMRVHRDLVHSADPAIAERSILELLRDRDPYVTMANFCGVGPEAASLAVEWLEAEPAQYSCLEVNLWNAFPPEVLRPFAKRLVRIFEERQEKEHWMLARVLIEMEDALADEKMLEILSRDPSIDEGTCAVILEWLLTRSPQAPAPAMRRMLEDVLRTGGGCQEQDVLHCRTSAALLLARGGSLEAMWWLLANYWSWPRPYWELARWIEATWEDARRDCTKRAVVWGLNSREEEEPGTVSLTPLPAESR